MPPLVLMMMIRGCDNNARLISCLVSLGRQPDYLSIGGDNNGGRHVQLEFNWTRQSNDTETICKADGNQ